jgi:putative oxidoreductase
MKKLFSININPQILDVWLLLLRIFVSAFMLTHGWPKFMKLIGGDFQFADPLGVGVEVSLFLAVFSEFFCSILLIVGLASRLVTLPLIVTMFVAAFVVHWDDPFGKKEFALLYCLIYITLLVTGPGRYSADAKLIRQ